MSDKKQSSVEWLVDYIKNLEKYPYKTIQELEEKAKQMHEKEIMQAYVYGAAYQIDLKYGFRPEIYYQETFKK